MVEITAGACLDSWGRPWAPHELLNPYRFLKIERKIWLYKTVYRKVIEATHVVDSIAGFGFISSNGRVEKMCFWTNLLSGAQGMCPSPLAYTGPLDNRSVPDIYYSNATSSDDSERGKILRKSLLQSKFLWLCTFINARRMKLLLKQEMIFANLSYLTLFFFVVLCSMTVEFYCNNTNSAAMKLFFFFNVIFYIIMDNLVISLCREKRLFLKNTQRLRNSA